MYQQEEASADIRTLLRLVYGHPEAVLALKTLRSNYVKAEVIQLLQNQRGFVSDQYFSLQIIWLLHYISLGKCGR